MAKTRRQKLKVFRTPIGFHDAYVAAPSRKAALEAWGANTDLFAAGIAEQVNDEKWMKEALERPGEVIRRARGSAKEHSAALEKSAESKSARPSRSGNRLVTAKRGKEPSRSALDNAEKALSALEKKQAQERGRLDREERALAERRETLEEMQAKAIDAATARRDEAEERYRLAVARWEGSK